MILRRARLQSLAEILMQADRGKGTASAPQGSVRVLSIDRPDLRRVFLERIEMHHPVENDGVKFSAVGIAFRLRGDRSLEPELRIRSQHFLLAALWRGAEIHV